jgi:hypothetical protein
MFEPTVLTSRVSPPSKRSGKMKCTLGSCYVDQSDVHEATVLEYHQSPYPLMCVSIQEVGTRDVWYTSDDPLPIGSPIKVHYSDRRGWYLEST